MGSVQFERKRRTLVGLDTGAASCRDCDEVSEGSGGCPAGAPTDGCSGGRSGARFGRVADVATVVLRALTFRLRAWLSSFFAPEPKRRGPVPMGREVAACASCGVDETLSDLTGLTASDRLLCFDCASEEAAAVVAAAMRDPATVRVIDEAKRSGAWAEALAADGWEPGEEGDIPTARVISKLMEPIEQRRADRADLAALLRLLGPTDAVVRASRALARGETMAQAWEQWTAADRERLSDVLALDVTTASWELVRGVL